MEIQKGIPVPKTTGRPPKYDFDLDESGDIVELEFKAGCVDHTVYDFPFDNATFTKGDLVSLTIQVGNNVELEVYGTIVFELDMTT